MAQQLNTPVIMSKKQPHFRRVHRRLGLLSVGVIIALIVVAGLSYKIFHDKFGSNDVSQQASKSLTPAEKMAQDNKNAAAAYDKQIDQAKTNANKASLLLSKASVEANLKEYDQALTDSKAAYDLNPTYSTAYQTAVAAKMANQIDDAKKYIALAIKLNSSENDPADKRLNDYQYFQQELGK